MGFGRKWLDEILTNEDLSPKEKAQKIMDEHIAVTNGLKDERDGYKADAEKATELQKKLDDIANGEDFQKKYEEEHKAFEDFKKQRIRVNVGECTMKELYDYNIPTWSNWLLFRSFMKSIWTLGPHPVKTIYAVRLERYCRKVAIQHVKEGKDSMSVWDRVDSTKKL